MVTCITNLRNLLQGMIFHFSLEKIIIRYKRVGYNLTVMRRSVCLVFNPTMGDKYAAFFNCMPLVWVSDSMMAPTKFLTLVGWGRSFLSVAWPTGVQLFIFCSGFQ